MKSAEQVLKENCDFKLNGSSESICPAGEVFPLPKPDDYDAEFKRIKKLANEQSMKGREIVVLMGVGFVGAVMAGVVADSKDKETNEPKYFVIGMQRPSSRSCAPRGRRREDARPLHTDNKIFRNRRKLPKFRFSKSI